MSFDLPPTPVVPTLPQPVAVGQVQGSKPKLKSPTPTFLGGDTQANAPISGGTAPTGKTFLGQ